MRRRGRRRRLGGLSPTVGAHGVVTPRRLRSVSVSTSRMPGSSRRGPSKDLAEPTLITAAGIGLEPEPEVDTIGDMAAFSVCACATSKNPTVTAAMRGRTRAALGVSGDARQGFLSGGSYVLAFRLAGPGCVHGLCFPRGRGRPRLGRVLAEQQWRSGLGQANYWLLERSVPRIQGNNRQTRRRAQQPRTGV